MSRIWKLPISIPENVQASLKESTVSISGPKWSLDFLLPSQARVDISDSEILVHPVSEDSHAFWWTVRSIINGMVTWVTEWFTKALEINGVGYKFEIQWELLVLSVWYSHKVEMSIPQDLSVSLDEKKKNILYVSWADKQRVGQFASQIKAKKKPEPYKWKGIKYREETIRRKAGKSGSK